MSRYTYTRWDGKTHQSVKSQRDTLCGISKVNRPEVSGADGDGCHACANERFVRDVREASVRLEEWKA